MSLPTPAPASSTLIYVDRQPRTMAIVTATSAYSTCCDAVTFLSFALLLPFGGLLHFALPYYFADYALHIRRVVLRGSVTRYGKLDYMRLPCTSRNTKLTILLNIYVLAKTFAVTVLASQATRACSLLPAIQACLLLLLLQAFSSC